MISQARFWPKGVGWVPPTLFLVLWIAVALVGPWLPLTPNAVDLPAILAGPGPGSLLGSDDLGRPVLDRLLVGARIAFLVGFGVVALSALVGVLVGGVGAYAGGWLDLVLVRLIDVFLAFPGILLAIALAGILGPGINNLIIALSVTGWVGYARLTRAQILALKERDHVTAARALGAETDGKPLVLQIRQLGQRFFGEPAPNGYPDVTAPWLNTSTMLGRWNFALQLTSGRLPKVQVDLSDLTNGANLTEVANKLVTALLPGHETETLTSALVDLLGHAPGKAVLGKQQVGVVAGLLVAAPLFQWH